MNRIIANLSPIIISKEQLTLCSGGSDQTCVLLMEITHDYSQHMDDDKNSN